MKATVTGVAGCAAASAAAAADRSTAADNRAKAARCNEIKRKVIFMVEASLFFFDPLSYGGASTLVTMMPDRAADRDETPTRDDALHRRRFFRIAESGGVVIIHMS